jgi:hypothetical protein
MTTAPDIATIRERIKKEANDFRKEMLRLSKEEIYKKSYEINVVTEVADFLDGWLREEEDAEKINHGFLAMLDELTKDGGFFNAFFAWDEGGYEADVSSYESCSNTLQLFFASWLRAQLRKANKAP